MINLEKHRPHRNKFTTVRSVNSNRNGLDRNAHLTRSEAKKSAQMPTKYYALLSTRSAPNTPSGYSLNTPKAIWNTPSKKAGCPIFARSTWLHTRCSYHAAEKPVPSTFQGVTTPMPQGVTR